MNGSPRVRLLVPLVAASVITGLLLVQPQALLDGYDLARMHQCYKADFRAAVLAGEWPWWNPFTALGRPFFADGETATLYPPSWLVLPLGVNGGILAMVWLHLALAVAGTRRLGERLGLSPALAAVAGISFALSGALLGRVQAGQLQVFGVICLWPWIWHAALRLQDEPGAGAVAAGGGWLALALLAGSPQVLWCGLVPLAALLAVRTPSLRALGGALPWFAAAAILAAGLAAAQLLPFAELVREGNRPLHDASFATRGGEAGLSWLTLLVPSRPWLHANNEFNLYGGAVFFLLAAAALAHAGRDRAVRALAAAALLGAVLALGDGTVVLPRLAEWVPGFAGIRYPSRYALAGVLVVNLLAAGWLDRALREQRIGRPVLITGLALQAAALVAGLFAQQHTYAVPAVPANERQLLADLRQEGLPADGAPPRLALPAALMRSDAGAQFGLATATGFNNPALARTWTALYLMTGEPLPDFHRAEVKDEVIVKLADWPGFFSLSAVDTMPGHRVRFAAPPVPRAFLSPAPMVVADWRDAVARIRAGHDFVRAALVEQALPGIGGAGGPGAWAQIVHFGRNRVEVACRTAAPALLVLAEAWYPGWTARVNGGAAVPAVPANGWMRAVTVPAGESRVVFEFLPTHAGLGAAISAGSAFGLLLLWRRGRRPAPAGGAA